MKSSKINTELIRREYPMLLRALNVINPKAQKDGTVK